MEAEAIGAEMAVGAPLSLLETGAPRNLLAMAGIPALALAALAAPAQRAKVQAKALAHLPVLACSGGSGTKSSLQ